MRITSAKDIKRLLSKDALISSLVDTIEIVSDEKLPIVLWKSVIDLIRNPDQITAF